ncbi:MAG: TlpA family protein disulfide reductase [Brevefilum sp.]|nr:TlpA family protein disulfide reductase [Brevefilum sp.]
MMADSVSSPNNKRRVNLWAVAAFAGVLFVLVLIGLRLFQNDSSPVELGKKPQDFTLTTYDGDVIDTADLRGKVVLVNFWASWCATCDEEAALLEQAWQVYQADDAQRVIFLGVAYMDTEPASRAYLAEYGVTYPNGPDLRGAISKRYQVNSVPETYILDPEGTLRYLKIGSFISLDEIISAVDAVVALVSN